MNCPVESTEGQHDGIRVKLACAFDSGIGLRILDHKTVGLKHVRRSLAVIAALFRKTDILYVVLAAAAASVVMF